ncbi:MAG: HAD-IIB family hydrolase, partial [Erysipelotrichaceae bacterium]|nr:HAD-IIB family hydrolase [Erysipelotrichaceae bacterium]
MVDEKDRMYVNMVDDGLIEMQKTINSPIPAIGEYDGIKDVYEIVFFHKGHKLKETIDMFPHLKVTYWTENGVDMICSDGSKASGISHVLEHYGITSEEMMAFGDANNDLEMLQMAGIGVCMGDGEEEVRNIADYITETTENDGIYQALKYYCII